jgi:hypothetical protein
MLGLLTRPVRRFRSRPARAATRIRLGLQRLESRDCPSTPDLRIATNGSSITFDYSQGPSQSVFIEGSVSDDNPANLRVTLSGVVQGDTYTDGDGNFSITLTASGLGTIYAQTIDRDGEESNVDQVELVNNAPSISFDVRMGLSGWYIDGSVNDEYASGLTVTFSSSIPGLDGQSVTVGSGDTFGYSLGSSNVSGNISATVTDWWGESDTAFGSI